MAAGSGLTVASIYYAQPLLEAIRQDLGMSVAATGLIVTASQSGYALGLAFLVPLGDLVERRVMAVWMTSEFQCAWRQWPWRLSPPCFSRQPF